MEGGQGRQTHDEKRGVARAALNIALALVAMALAGVIAASVAGN